MAQDKQSRLAEIYTYQKSQGGGIGSTISSRVKEKFDPRQLINQKGLLAAMFPALKAYKAIPDRGKTLSSGSMPNVGALSDSLLDISEDMSATRRITLQQSKDINVISKNVSKIAKKLTGSAASRAGAFFAGEDAKEAEREAARKGRSPSAVGGGGGDKKGSAVGSFFGSLLNSMGGGLGKGLGIAAIGAGIGGFFAGLAVGGAAVNKLGGASGIKDMLVSLAEGLGAFSGQSLLAFGALLAGGALFGAYSGKLDIGKQAGAALGITAVGAGIGGFLAGLSLGGAAIEVLGGASGIKDMLVSLGEGLNAFNPTSLAAFGTLLAAGAIFGATGMSGPAALGIGAVGVGIAAFLTAIAGGAKIIAEFGGHTALQDLFTSVATGLSAFNNVGGENLASTAKGLLILAPALGAFFAAEGLGKVIDLIKGAGQKVLSFFGWNSEKGESKEGPSLFEKIADSLKPLESVNGQNLKNVGEGVSSLAKGLLDLAKLTDEDLIKAGKASVLASGMATDAEMRKATPTSPQAPESKSPTPGASGFDYQAFADTLGQRESSGNYEAVNDLGYLGKYQFGPASLEDAGLLKKGASKSGLKGLDDPSNWTNEGGKQGFLKDKKLQEKIMKKHTERNKKRLEKMGVIGPNSSPADIAGYLSTSHLLGTGGARDLSQGKSGADAYGTTASEYFNLGAGTQAQAIKTADSGNTDEFAKRMNKQKGSFVGSMQNMNIMGMDMSQVDMSQGYSGPTRHTNQGASMMSTAPETGAYVQGTSRGIEEMKGFFGNTGGLLNQASSGGSTIINNNMGGGQSSGGSTKSSPAIDQSFMTQMMDGKLLAV